MTDLSKDTVEQILRSQLSDQGAFEWRTDLADLMAHSTRAPEFINGYPSFAPHFVEQSYEGFSAAEMALMKVHQANSFYWKTRNSAVGLLVAKYFTDCRRVLDIGCGTGFLTDVISRTLPEAKVYATDIFIEGLALTSETLGDHATLFHLDATDIPFKDAFDLVTSFDVLEHIPNDEDALASMYDALRSGGYMLHFVPQHPFLFSPADEKSCHYRRYATDELQRKIEAAGFEVLYSSSFMSLLFPLFAASRLKSKLFNTYSLSGEHDLPGWVSGIFTTVQNFENSTLERGTSYPCGVSRIVVAVKR